VKRLSAILFSVLLVWMQTVVSTQPTVLSTESTECMCSNCGKTCCCVTPFSPDSAPAPATPVRAGVQTELTMLAATLVAWTLPATEPQVPSLSASPPLTAMGVPLFTRHCALLI
jgi:hypothetical protein